MQQDIAVVDSTGDFMNKPHISIDTLVREHWSVAQRQNAEVVLQFIQSLMNDHDFDLIKRKFVSTPYVQHNRSMEDGISGVVESVSRLTKRFPDFSYEVKHVFVDSGYVVVHSHATMNRKDRGNDKKGFNIIDTWLVKDGMPVEHWDAVQPLDAFMRMYYWLTGGSILNKNGVF